MPNKTCSGCGKPRADYQFQTPHGKSKKCVTCRGSPPLPRECDACHKFKASANFARKTSKRCKACTELAATGKKLEADKKRRESPAYVMWEYAKARSRQLGIPFTITVDDILIPARCPIREVKLTIPTGKATDNTMSLDRVEPALGYVPGNVRVISLRANQQKNDLSAVTAQKIVDYITKKG